VEQGVAVVVAVGIDVLSGERLVEACRQLGHGRLQALVALLPANVIGPRAAFEVEVRLAARALLTDNLHRPLGPDEGDFMRTRIPLLLAIALAVGFAPAPFPRRERARDDPKRIEGHWRQVRGPNVGMNMLFEPRRMTFSGWEGSAAGARISYDLILDPRKYPATVDLVFPDTNGAMFLGIYKLEGDTFTFCYRRARLGRPTAFAGPGTEVYKRVKP
jgi:uncharacterized protein (TIGR03067 family)